MAKKIHEQRATVTGLLAAKKQKIKRLESRQEGEPRRTDGTLVTAVTGLTISENYNSVKVEVGITLPTTFENRKEAMAEAWDFIDDELVEKLDSAKKLMGEI